MRAWLVDKNGKYVKAGGTVEVVLKDGDPVIGQVLEFKILDPDYEPPTGVIGALLGGTGQTFDVAGVQIGGRLLLFHCTRYVRHKDTINVTLELPEVYPTWMRGLVNSVL